MLLAVQLPRYARVNLLHTTSDDVIKRFCKEGYLLVDSLSTLSLTSCPASSSVNYQTGHCGRCAQCLAAEDSSSSADPHQCPMAAEKVFCRDTHVPELLVFPFSCSLVDHPLYTNTDIILQDKVCMPAHLVFVNVHFLLGISKQSQIYNLAGLYPSPVPMRGVNN